MCVFDEYAARWCDVRILEVYHDACVLEDSIQTQEACYISSRFASHYLRVEERAEIGIRELLQCRDVADSAGDRVHNRRESLRNFRDHAVSTSADLLLQRFA